MCCIHGYHWRISYHFSYIITCILGSCFGLLGGKPLFTNPSAADDDFNLVTLPYINESTGTISTKTTWTLLLYLTSATEGCVGGETVFYTHDRKSPKEEVAIAPETGLLLLHKHGDDCLLVSTEALSSSLAKSARLMRVPLA